MHQGEDGGVSADAEAEREGYGQAEERRFGKTADGETQAGHK